MDHGTLLIQLKMILCTRLMYSFKLLENEPKKKKRELVIILGQNQTKKTITFCPKIQPMFKCKARSGPCMCIKFFDKNRKTQNAELRFLTTASKAAYSSKAILSMRHRMNSGRNSQKQVTATNPTVNGPDTNLGNRHLAVSVFFNAISTVKHDPWSTKNHVILNVGSNLPM